MPMKKVAEAKYTKVRNNGETGCCAALKSETGPVFIVFRSVNIEKTPVYNLGASRDIADTTYISPGGGTLVRCPGKKAYGWIRRPYC